MPGTTPNVDTIICGDCLEEMKKLPDRSIDAIVTDPPYELAFMGKKWDASGIAYNVDMWGECLRVLKPGGHLLAFGGAYPRCIDIQPPTSPPEHVFGNRAAIQRLPSQDDRLMSGFERRTIS